MKGRAAAFRRRHADLPVGRADGRPDGAPAPAASSSRPTSRRILDRNRPAHGRRERIHRAACARDSTASAWACRISTPRCRRRSTASSREEQTVGIIRRRAKRLPLGQHRPDLRPAQADDAHHGRDAGQGDCGRSRPHLDLQLRAHAAPVQVAAPDPEEELPAPQVKLDMLALCIKRLTGAGYVYIGMDHFAKPDDELAVAQREGRTAAQFPGLFDPRRNRPGVVRRVRPSAPSTAPTARMKRRWKTTTAASTPASCRWCAAWRCRPTISCGAA